MFLNQRSVINNIKKQLEASKKYISIPNNTRFFPTKGTSGISHGSFIRDKVLERKVYNNFLHANYNNILNKYKNNDPLFHLVNLPKHYAIKISMMEGLITNGENILICFPSILGINNKKKDDYFSFEIVDNWKKVFLNIIFPCVERICTPSTIEQIKQIIPKNKIEYISYLTSIFHEVGHNVGPWRIFPSFDKRLKVTKFQSEVLTELATDALLGKNLREYKEIILCVLLQRLFWFGRKNFDKNEVSAGINSDNDCWIGSYLWEKFKELNCIQIIQDRWEINIDNAPHVFIHVYKEIEKLYHILNTIHPMQHKHIIETWMKKNLEYSYESGYLLPNDFKEVLLKCKDIPYSVQYQM